MKIFESLYILKRYNTVIRNLMKVMIDNNFNKIKDSEWNEKTTIHYVSLYFTIIMDTYSYLDEYDNFFGVKTEVEFSERILMIKKITKPSIIMIRKWKDIGRLRNDIIAHTWRKGNQFTFSNLNKYDTPRNFQDLLYLQTYLEINQAVIDAEFYKESQKVMEHIESIKSKAEIKNPTDPNFEYNIINLVNKVNKNCSSENRGYEVDKAGIFSF